ncbi:hypothetical protein E9993_04010 [Labilibacter sediminis]|nr:hypothetical protein E9993_04010 [Labilibacter sediminis]
MQTIISNIQITNTFSCININDIEHMSFFDKNGLSQSYIGDAIKNKIIKFLQNEVLAVVNMKGGSLAIVLPD